MEENRRTIKTQEHSRVVILISCLCKSLIICVTLDHKINGHIHVLLIYADQIALSFNAFWGSILTWELSVSCPNYVLKKKKHTSLKRGEADHVMCAILWPFAGSINLSQQTCHSRRTKPPKGPLLHNHQKVVECVKSDPELASNRPHTKIYHNKNDL